MLQKKPATGINRYLWDAKFAARCAARKECFGSGNRDIHAGAATLEDAARIGIPGELRGLDWLPADREDCAQARSYDRFPDCILGKVQIEIRSTGLRFDCPYETSNAIIWKEKIYPEFKGIYLFTLVNVESKLVFITGWCTSEEFLSIARYEEAGGKMLGGKGTVYKSRYLIPVGHQRKIATLRPYLIENNLWSPHQTSASGSSGLQPDDLLFIHEDV
jgi:hypothetical protein